MYERRLEHSLYKTIAELQRLRLLRQLNSPTEDTTTPTPPNRAKQTQFPNSSRPANQFQSNELSHHQRFSPTPKQTQSNPIPTTRPAEFRLPPARPAVSSVPSTPLIG
jgi:hypothetical protein